MAPLSPPSRRADGPDRPITGGSRGQLLVTTALVVSVLFVTLALLLNSAIFAENLGTRGADGDVGHDANTHRAAVTAMTERTVGYVNANHNSSHVALQRNLTHSLTRWENMSARHGAVVGESSEVTLRSTTNVTRIAQPTSRELTSAENDSDWQLVNGTTGVREFELRVDENSLVELTAAEAENASDLENASVFRTTISATTDRRVFLYYNETENAVAVAAESAPGTLDGTCHGNSGTVAVNLTEATVDGDSCGVLDFVADIDDPTELWYTEGTKATGTYTLLVNGSTSLVEESNYNDVGDDGPHAVGRFHAVTVQSTYVSSAITYRTEIRVTPGETDA